MVIPLLTNQDLTPMLSTESDEIDIRTTLIRINF